MRVLYFSDNGSDHNRRFLEKISSFGHTVDFLDITGEEPRFAMPAGVTRIRAARTLPRDAAPDVVESFLPELQSWIKKLRPDIVHAGPVQSCGYVAALSGYHPMIVMSWGSDLLLGAGKNSVWKRATEVALGGADGFACDCEAVRGAGLRYANFAPTHIAQFPWGLEGDSFSPQGEKPENWVTEPGTVTVLCTRAWAPLYDIDVLLKAFAEAFARNENLRLLLVGDGLLRQEIESFIKSNGLENIVTLRSEKNPANMPRWFRAADIYVSCARSDGTSISLLEAMASGLPVVVSDIPSNREWVSADENGWLARVGSSQDFAAHLLRAADLSVEAKREIAVRNRKIIEERADWDKNFPKLMKLYDTVSASPRQSCVSR